MKFTAEEKRIIGLLHDWDAGQGGQLGELNRLECRWVSAREDLGIPKLVADARVYGGAEPGAPWAHIGGSVENFMKRHQGRPGVLFIYDGEKIRGLTAEERAADWADPNSHRGYYYAKKPIDGLDLKDALVGMIRFDPPGNTVRER